MNHYVMAQAPGEGAIIIVEENKKTTKELSQRGYELVGRIETAYPASRLRDGFDYQRRQEEERIREGIEILERNIEEIYDVYL